MGIEPSTSSSRISELAYQAKNERAQGPQETANGSGDESTPIRTLSYMRLVLIEVEVQGSGT